MPPRKSGGKTTSAMRDRRSGTSTPDVVPSSDRSTPLVVSLDGDPAHAAPRLQLGSSFGARTPAMGSAAPTPPGNTPLLAPAAARASPAVSLPGAHEAAEPPREAPPAAALGSLLTLLVAALAALALASLYWAGGCPLLCPSRVTCDTVWNVDFGSMLPGAHWLYERGGLYTAACRQVCPLRLRCTVTRGDVLRRKAPRAALPAPHAAAGTGGRAGGGGAADGRRFADLLAMMPDANKTVWMNSGHSTFEAVLLSNGWEFAPESDLGDALQRTPPLTMVHFVRRNSARQSLRRNRFAAALVAPPDAPLVNFIDWTHFLTEKYLLQAALRDLATDTGDKRGYDLQPLTILLSDVDECTSFLNNERNYDDGRVWLVKASAESRGRGIFIFPSLRDVAARFIDPATGACDSAAARRRRLALAPSADVGSPAAIEAAPSEDSGSESSSASGSDSASAGAESLDESNNNNDDDDTGDAGDLTGDFVLQRYLLNPLLLGGKKMEIRSYWMIASVEPLIVLYHDGTVRRTTRDYTPGDWSDPLVHITNTYQQKLADPNYEGTKDERKWTLERMERFLIENGRVAAPGWFNSTLKPRLKEMIAVVVKAALAALAASAQHPIRSRTGIDTPRHAYQLLGMDTILDDTLRPWLTEIQVGPGLSVDDAVKRALIGRMLDEVLCIALEVRLRKLRGLPLTRLDSVLNFEVVGNEAK
jgi:hypothetical protein